MIACLLKIIPEKGNLRNNFEKLLKVMEKIDEPDIDVFITSEGYLDGYVSTEEEIKREDFSRYAVKDKHLSQIGALAKERKAWFILGCIDDTREGPKNAAIIFNREGKIEGRYYKIHLQKEDKKFVTGSELPVFNADFGLFGVMICADRRWPETVRTLALKGAKVIFNPTYGMHGLKNECMMKTRSYESEVFICFVHPLESLITNPSGNVEGHLVSNRDGFLVHNIDLKIVDVSRRSDMAHLKDRVPSVYV